MQNLLTPSVMRDFIERLDGMAFLDSEGRYTYVSSAWETYTGCKSDDVLGRKVWEVIPETHATEVYQTKKPVTRGMVIKNGRPAFTTYYPILGDDGSVLGIMLYIVLRGNDGLNEMVRHIKSLTNQIEAYRQELSRERGAKYSLDNILGEGRAIIELKEQIRLAARSSSTVLIEGETGSGKELIAHAIHALSARSSNQFVRVNCAAIPSELMESEFFGYTAGAFTGASSKGKPGRFALADGGSIFLDEINLLPSTMQPKFLRVLQEREIDPVGSDRSVPVDIRVIVACNTRLEKLVESGAFRSDLYFRLNVVRIGAPALREHREDIPLLVRSFISRLNCQLGMMVERISDDAMTLLASYDWPGNIRELHNAVESAMNQANGLVLERRHFSGLETRICARQCRQSLSAGAFNLSAQKRLFEKRLIQDALDAAEGNRSEAAKLLGISRTMLYKKLSEYEADA